MGTPSVRTLGLALALLCACTCARGAAVDGDWPTYGHDKGGQRHSPLTQITPANVANLKPAWVYHMAPAAVRAPGAAPQHDDDPAKAPAAQLRQSQMTPLVVGGRMFITTPYGNAAALDPVTGKELWVTPVGGAGVPSLRGVEYWKGDKAHRARILFGTGDGRLLALDAATGAFVPDFGDRGVVNLKTPQIMQGFAKASYLMTSPPLVVGDLVITGSRVQEQPLQGPSGDVRAWDVRTGKLVWTFHTIPRPGEPNYGTWAAGAADKRSGTNVWGFMTADVGRGILYLPVADPTYDRYGGDRPGDDLYGSSLVAVQAKTGKYLWHFQLTHHDIWDLDTQSAPLLFEAQIGGRAIPAVAVVNKAGLMFMFDRVTGKPLRPIVETPVPVSDAFDEKASPTQPMPTTPPLARNSFKYPDDLVDVSPELRAWCDDFFKSNAMQGTVAYEPYHADHTAVHFPGAEGGPNWDGQSFDPKTGYLILPVNNLALAAKIVATPGGPMAYRQDWKYFRQPDTRDACQKPPWATLTAVDSATGKIAWQVPLGVTDHLPAAVQNTGRPGHGGAITTDSGLVFIGFSDDQRFRAFDVRTGKVLWTWRLDASAHAAPVTYRGADGRQYVAVTSTGGTYIGTPVTSDALTAFALPR